MSSPLDGVKVVEVAIFAFVPSAAVVLTDWGADVIKIEHPVLGDPQRSIAAWGVPAETKGYNHLFEVANRGKRTVGLDISTPEGHEILMQLVDEADVFLTNFLPAARRKLGIEPDVIMGRNPRIVYGRGSAQGQRGDASERGGFDSISYWGRSGASIGVTPPESEWPLTMPGPGFGDLQSGLTLAGAVAAGMYHRERTGTGTVIDVSLMSVGIWSMGMTISGTSAIDVDTLPHLYHDDATNPLINLYRTSDGHLISLGFLQSDRYWEPFCRLVERPDLLADSRYVDEAARETNSRACVAALEELFAQRTLADWEATLSEQDGQWDVLLPPGRVRFDPQVRANGYVQLVEHDGGAIALVPSPVQFDCEAARPRKAPQPGADTNQILAGLGIDDERLADLRARQIVR